MTTPASQSDDYQTEKARQPANMQQQFSENEEEEEDAARKNNQEFLLAS